MSKIQRFETHIPIDELMNQYFDFELIRKPGPALLLTLSPLISGGAFHRFI